MANRESKYTLVVEDQSEGAVSASDNLAILAERLRTDTQELANMQRALRNLRAGGSESADAVKQLGDRIDLHRAVIAQTQLDYVKLGGGFGSVKRGAADTANATGEATSAVARLTGLSADQLRSELTAVEARIRDVSAATAGVVPTEAISRQLAEDRQAADAASAALTRLASSQAATATDARTLSANIARLETELRDLDAATKGVDVSVPGVDAARRRVTAIQPELAAARARFRELTGSLDGLRPPAQSAGVNLATLGGAAGVLPGPLGQVTARLGPLSALLKSGFAGAALGVAAAFVAVSVAAIALTGALFRVGVSLASTRREQDLTFQALVATKGAINGVTTSAQDLSAAVNSLAPRTAATRDELNSMASSLYEAGLRGAALKDALEGAATVAVARGKQAADAWSKQAAAVNAAGGSVRRLADDVDKRFGGVAQARLLSLNVQFAKMRENLGRVFSGLKIDRLLEAVDNVLGVFREGSAVADGLKATFETLFQPMIDGAADGAPLVKRFIQGVTIAVLDLAIMFLLGKKRIKEMFGGGEFFKNVDMARVVVIGARVAVYSLAAGLALGAVAMATLAAGAAAVIGPVIVVGYLLKNTATSVWKAFTSIVDQDWKGLGDAIVQGLTLGIFDSADELIESIKGLALDAMKAFKDTLGIKSPSFKMRLEGGRPVSQGAALGVDDEAPKVRRAVVRMAKPLPAIAEREATKPAAQPLAVRLGLPFANREPRTARVAPVAPVAPIAPAAPVAPSPAVSVSFPRIEPARVPAERPAERAKRERPALAIVPHTPPVAPPAGDQVNNSRTTNAKTFEATFGDINVYVKDGDGATEIAKELKPELTNMLEDIARQLGVAGA